jgi:hypothetical protein
MILAKDPLVAQGKGLEEVLDIFVTMVQDDDRYVLVTLISPIMYTSINICFCICKPSFIYLNAVKGLCALADVHGNRIISKLAQIYTDTKRPMDHRLRVGEALQQTVQRCGDALAKYGMLYTYVGIYMLQYID